jgi:hypothetical protein
MAAQALKTKILPVGEWTPDMPDLGRAPITAQNVIPWSGAYKSFPSMSAQSAR